MSKFREIFWRDRATDHVWYLRADTNRPMPKGPWNSFDGWELRLYPHGSQWDVSFSRGYALKDTEDGWGYTGGRGSHPQSMFATWQSPIGQPVVPTDAALRKMGMAEYMELQGILKRIDRRWPDLGVIGKQTSVRRNPSGEPKEKFYLLGSNLRPFVGAVLEWAWPDGQKWDMTIDTESQHVYVVAGDESGAFKFRGFDKLGAPTGRPPISLGMAASMMWTRITERIGETLAEKERESARRNPARRRR